MLCHAVWCSAVLAHDMLLRCCMSLQVSPVTGQQEFVVLGGHGSDGMSDLVPHALDTATFL